MMDEEERLKRIENKLDKLIKKYEIVHRKYRKLQRHKQPKHRYSDVIYG